MALQNFQQQLSHCEKLRPLVRAQKELVQQKEQLVEQILSDISSLENSLSDPNIDPHIRREIPTDLQRLRSTLTSEQNSLTDAINRLSELENDYFFSQCAKYE